MACLAPLNGSKQMGQILEIQKWYLALTWTWRGGFAALARPKIGEVRVPT